MEFLRYKYDEEQGVISIESNTSWSILPIGNFMLSKHDGYGNEENIRLIIPQDISYGQGAIYFSYGKNHCTSLEPIHVYQQNKNYFSVSTKVVTLQGKGSTSHITVQSNDNFQIINPYPTLIKTLQYGIGDILVISNTDDDFGVSGETYMTIRNLLNGISENVYVNQFVYSDSDGVCVLDASYDIIDNYTYVIHVTSLYNGKYNSFTVDVPNGVSLLRQNLTTFVAKINNEEAVGNSFSLIFKNDCSEFELQLSVYDTNKSSIFDVQVSCDGQFTVDGGILKMGIVSQTINNFVEMNKLIENNKKQYDKC